MDILALAFVFVIGFLFGGMYVGNIADKEAEEMRVKKILD